MVAIGFIYDSRLFRTLVFGGFSFDESGGHLNLLKLIQLNLSLTHNSPKYLE